MVKRGVWRLRKACEVVDIMKVTEVIKFIESIKLEKNYEIYN